MKKDETVFRHNKVLPFLKKLKNTVSLPIQQMGISGDPDFILCVRGLFIGLELKAEGGKLSKLQAYKQKKIEKAEGLYIVANPENWPAVQACLYKLDKGYK